MSFFKGFLKTSASVCTPASELVEEHEHLIKILRKHKRGLEEKEANKQAKELKGYREKMGSPRIKAVLGAIRRRYLVNSPNSKDARDVIKSLNVESRLLPKKDQWLLDGGADSYDRVKDLSSAGQKFVRENAKKMRLSAPKKKL